MCDIIGDHNDIHYVWQFKIINSLRNWRRKEKKKKRKKKWRKEKIKS